MALYRYYQQTGGDEAWIPIQAHLTLDEIKPTFVTILAVDTLIDKSTPKDLIAKAKYQGPMYFDLDAEDIEDSIAGAKLLVKKLKEHELKSEDIQIFLSGKKGLHLIIPEVCFVQKVQPTQSLVAIYKEMAFSLAVDTMDFRVYTAKRGRQFRTCYNVRENGNYKVPISMQELEDLNAENYAELCKQPRVVSGHNPQWRGKFALLYDQACQKVGKTKPKASKPTPPEVLKQQLPVFEKLAKGEVETDAGFNIIAMQLCLYAREMKWEEDTLVNACQGIIHKHSSDGVRYNSPARRERELRRMFWYLEENPSFDYSVTGIRSCLKKVDEQAQDATEGEESSKELDTPDFGGVYKGVTAYMAAKGDDGDIAITNFTFSHIEVYRNLEDGMISAVHAKLCIRNKRGVDFVAYPSSFTGGTALQNAVASLGGSFSGTDVHARGVYQAMLKDSKRDVYVIDSEGINLFKTGKTISAEKKEFVVWADSEGIKSTIDMEAENLHVVYQGFPDPRGLYRTDLTAAPTMDAMLESDAGYNRLLNCYKSLIRSHSPEVMGKMVGWAIATFYAPLFQSVYKKFPLLHVYGPAGGGKTETTRGLLRMFYYKEEALETTPNSSIFAFQQMMSGSSSIPLLLDEYKPHVLAKERIDQVRAVLRDAYNAKDVQRGGGSKNVKDNYNALSTIKMAAPLVFVAEAPETETAIVERSVMVSFKRLAGKQQIECFKAAMQFYKDTEPLASLGLEIANNVVSTNNSAISLEKFEKSLAWANEKFLPAPDDWEKVAAGEMTQEEMRMRTVMRPRNVFNSTVSFFGLQIFKEILIQKFGKEVFDEHFGETVREMARSCFLGMEALAASTLPEYVKVLSVFSDMSKLPSTDSFSLTEGIDFNLSEFAGEPVLVIAAPQCYRKYRAYMRYTGASPLYPSEESFQLALREIPQYLKMGIGTEKLSAPTTVLGLDGLYRAAVTQWKGKAVELDL